MKVGVTNAERYLGEAAFIGEDLSAICARINKVFTQQHSPEGKHLPLPVCVVRHSAPQSIGSGAFTAVQFNTEDLDTHEIHNTSTNNHIFQIPDAGIYLFLANVTFAANGTGTRQVRWVLEDGSTFFGPWGSQAGAASGQIAVWSWSVARCSTNVRAQVQALQDSGGSLEIGDNSQYAQNHAAVIRIPWAV